MDSERLPRLLSIDGGGVRGLSALIILREIMEEIMRREEMTRTPLPCEYFDLIGGTSTGGLIAIMLGRLRMVLNIDRDKMLIDFSASTIASKLLLDSQRTSIQ